MLTLKELQAYYSSTLCDRYFAYHLATGETIKVYFYRESFCHLLGIQHITKDRPFLGLKGYRRIQSGNITLKTLKAMDKRQYGYIRNRIRFLDHMDELLMNGDLYRFYPDRIFPPTKIHASISKEQQDSDIYTPLSFIPLPENDHRPTRYLEHQEFKRILSREIIPIPPAKRCPRFNRETKTAMQASLDIALGKVNAKSYDSAAELFQELDKD